MILVTHTSHFLRKNLEWIHACHTESQRHLNRSVRPEVLLELANLWAIFMWKLSSEQLLLNTFTLLVHFTKLLPSVTSVTILLKQCCGWARVKSPDLSDKTYCWGLFSTQAGRDLPLCYNSFAKLLSAGVGANNPSLAVESTALLLKQGWNALREISAGRVWSHGRHLEPGEKLNVLNGRGEWFHHSWVSEPFTSEASGTTPTFRRRTTINLQVHVWLRPSESSLQHRWNSLLYLAQEMQFRNNAF